jgi:hypothetical protein
LPTHGNGNTEPLDRIIPAIENLFDFDNNSARSLRPTWRSAHQRSCSKTNAVACTKMILLGRQMREPDGRLLQLVPHDRGVRVDIGGVDLTFAGSGSSQDEPRSTHFLQCCNRAEADKCRIIVASAIRRSRNEQSANGLNTVVTQGAACERHPLRSTSRLPDWNSNVSRWPSRSTRYRTYRGLKIAVSVVRLRPWAPFLSMT